MQEHAIRFENINMTFRAKRKEVAALRDISLKVGRHTFTSIVGPSGCGKSTLLSLCAGLKFPSSGRTYCDGRAVEAVNTDIGFVTQDSNLFPWMTLRENVEFPLRVRGMSAPDRRARAQSQIDMVGLSGFEDHYPHQLSGGMQKRASIIRTLVYEPDVILMDEPFGALDAQTKMVLQDELLRMWSARKQTILFVTHDLTEAVALSDQVVVMSGRPGQIKGLFDVNLQRPRDVFQIHGQEGFADSYQQVWDCFRSELIEAEGPAAVTEISA
jgi:NitT/TauT family transport system ATP-binding protein